MFVRLRAHAFVAVQIRKCTEWRLHCSSTTSGSGMQAASRLSPGQEPGGDWHAQREWGLRAAASHYARPVSTIPGTAWFETYVGFTWVSTVTTWARSGPYYNAGTNTLHFKGLEHLSPILYSLCRIHYCLQRNCRTPFIHRPTTGRLHRATHSRVSLTSYGGTTCLPFAGSASALILLTLQSPSTAEVLASPSRMTSSPPFLPYIVALHVIRVNQDPPATPTTADFPPDSPISSHFAWAAPPTLFSMTDDVATAAKEGGFFVSAPAEREDALELSAWHGPRWGSLRNGLDDMIDYVAVVEFEGGVFLKSQRQRLQIVH
ncbi:hypothetical protein EVG20_g1724 [Dentipellis fragilis]|uniref:Uncharacterized protein n=1 Tax=Dentipellis fragilis TaxID=205917 RepID=A0A4Y9Z928_9AGAM|nr:hypothetical protein EVG20_g1724 [Dentipellis fragilis]